MPNHFLDSFFSPKRIALIGASERTGSMGSVLYRNLHNGHFIGVIDLVNPKYGRLNGQQCYRDVIELHDAPELAVICTPPDTVPGIVSVLAERGTRAAVIITAGAPHQSGDSAPDFKRLIMDAVGSHSMRIIGPNCLGVQSPAQHLNASFAHIEATPGSLAFVTQSGAMLTTVLDWAQPRGFGFSQVVSLGDMVDVDLADLLDYLANDTKTTAILLYVEAVTRADKFMAAASKASRIKPVVVIKAGRSAAGAHAAASHTGMLAGVDAVYDIAFRRCGMLRVFDMQELFAAAETLALSKPLKGERIVIVTNGGGPGVLAADAVVAGNHSGDPGATLATLSTTTLGKLNAVLPATWSHGNPVDIIGDAAPQRYVDAINILNNDNDIDALLVMNCPTAITSSMDSATAVAKLLQQTDKPAFTCWLGGATAHAARQVLRKHHVPCYDTPELAVEGIMHRVRFHRNQQLLQSDIAQDVEVSHRDVAAKIANAAHNEQREWLSAIEINLLLSEYHIPCVATYQAKDADEAQACAKSIGKPCVLKILSNDISHKSDAGGVVLNLESPDAVHDAAQKMLTRIRQAKPEAHIDGFMVQEMIHRPAAYELIVGFHRDPLFGPVLLFGQGGIAVEIINDRALELPPLDAALARQMIERTRISKLLMGFRNQPAVNMNAIVDVLLKMARLMVECPNIVEMDINPLLADQDDVIALDARVKMRTF